MNKRKWSIVVHIPIYNKAIIKILINLQVLISSWYPTVKPNPPTLTILRRKSPSITSNPLFSTSSKCVSSSIYPCLYPVNENNPFCSGSDKKWTICTPVWQKYKSKQEFHYRHCRLVTDPKPKKTKPIQNMSNLEKISFGSFKTRTVKYITLIYRST